MKIIVIAVFAAALAALFFFDVGSYLSLTGFKAHQAAFTAQLHANPLAFALGFAAVYITACAVSFPGAAVLTLAAGALFGTLWGTVIVSFASTIGATLAFLAARTVMADTVRKKFGQRLAAIDEGMQREGAFYLFTLRLLPIFPFFLVNLLMALTKIRATTFFWVSQLGMFAGTVAYVNAGTQLAAITSLKGVLSPSLLGAFVFLGVLPLLARRVVEALRARKVYQGHTRPKQFTHNIIAIGAGAGGLVTSYIAATVKAKVALIEAHEMGGDCLNTGCVPSKALIRAAKTAHDMRHASSIGLHSPPPVVDFAAVMQRVHKVISEIAPHDSVERYSTLGVECINGYAQLKDPWTVEVNGQRLTAPTLVLATGAAPFVPPIPGLKEAGFLTSDTLWQLTELPQQLIVLGGGPIGCELAQAFARLGAQVTQVEMAPRLLLREDPEVSDFITQAFEHDGVTVRTNTKATAVVQEGGSKFLVCEHAGSTLRIPFTHILCAVGRAARLNGYGLKELGIAHDRTIKVDDYGRTNFPNIYAVGDVCGPYQFTHAAAHTAWYAAVNGLFGSFKRFKIDYSVMPWVTFTAPEVARVGLNEADAKDKGIPYEVTRYGLDDLDRAIADGHAEGWVKVLTVPGKDRILGVTIVGVNGGELLAEWTLAMRHGLGLNKILATIHPYPTWAESAKYAAGVWKSARKPEKVLALLQRYFAWRRG